MHVIGYRNFGAEIDILTTCEEDRVSRTECMHVFSKQTFARSTATKNSELDQLIFILFPQNLAQRQSNSQRFLKPC